MNPASPAGTGRGIDGESGGTRAPGLHIALIEGNLGYRKVVSAYIQSQWPDAHIEAIDPYSQTMRGAGVTFGTDCDLMVLGGIGTRAEAISALARLRDHAQSTAEGVHGWVPPVILLVAHELAVQADALRVAGLRAFAPPSAPPFLHDRHSLGCQPGYLANVASGTANSLAQL